jgi:hypothetical protein
LYLGIEEKVSSVGTQKVTACFMFMFAANCLPAWSLLREPKKMQITGHQLANQTFDWLWHYCQEIMDYSLHGSDLMPM